MLGHMPHFTMHRHGDARPHPAVHLRELVARRMAGDMHEMIALGEHFHTQRRELVLYLEDRNVVARDDA